MTTTEPLFSRMARSGHEEIVHGFDPETGLRAVVAVHSTALGPALGGTRFYPYAGEADALEDALRLSEGMTYKSAAAGLDLGGGKAVILGDPSRHKTVALLHAYGRLVDGLGGRYITAEDVGTAVEDMVVVRQVTRWVTGLPRRMGGSGDPSPMTARGVLAAMRAVAARVWGSADLAGRRVLVQGVGKVGGALVGLLARAGAEVLVSDVDRNALEEVAAAHGTTVVTPETALEHPCDILAPCALGAVLSADVIPRLRCRAVVGSANNQLATPGDADRLAAAGVLYAPDFVANAGGIINIAVELEGYSEERAAELVEAIGDRMGSILDHAERHGTTPEAAALAFARRRVDEARSRDPSGGDPR